MRKNRLNLFCWLSCLFFFFVMLGVSVILANFDTKGSNPAFLFSLITLVGTFLYGLVMAHVYEESCMCKGKTRKIHKLNKKKQKLINQRNFLEQKTKDTVDISKLQCQIHELEVGLSDNTKICPECKAKMYNKACFCSNCGGGF